MSERKEKTAGMYTADLCDRFSDDPELGLQVASPALQSLGGVDFLAGPAETISCLDDNALFRELVGTPGNGRIIVIDGHASTRRSLLGDIQASRARDNGWGGIIVHGYVRDRVALTRLLFPIYALGTVPLRPLKEAKGEIGAELNFLNVRICPGMWIYADTDGIIVLNRSVEIPTPDVSG